MHEREGKEGSGIDRLPDRTSRSRLRAAGPRPACRPSDAGIQSRRSALTRSNRDAQENISAFRLPAMVNRERCTEKGRSKLTAGKTLDLRLPAEFSGLPRCLAANLLLRTRAR